jgi:L-threonylcarbamoyladenylate synthase
MQILPATEESFVRAARVVKKGGLVIYPTDTVYGLGCDPLNDDAVIKVFKVKGRERKALPILASSVANVERIAHLGGIARKAADKLWPGAITFVLEKKPLLPSAVTCSSPSVGVRIPNHPAALRLISLCGGLLVGTSANISGLAPPKTAQEAAQQIGDKVDLTLNGGPAPIGRSSTVLALTSDKPTILRSGPISAREIAEALELEEHDLVPE